MIFFLLRIILSTVLWHGPIVLSKSTTDYITCVKAHHYKHINQCPKGKS